MITKITFNDINESLFDLDSEYREALAKAVMKLKYISDSPLQLSYGTDKQQTEWNKFSTRPLNAEEIKNIINYMQEDMKGDFQYGRFATIASEYLEIAKNMETQTKTPDDIETQTEEFKIEFYTEEEIKEIIKSKTELFYVDDGIDEAIIKLEDIPDFIVDYNRKLEMRDLKFFKVGKEVYEPDITTYGEFLNSIKPELREKIIDRLVALQTNESEVKKYKIIDEDVFSQVKDKLEQEQKQLKKQKKKDNREVR